jgi:hypothetical protein
VASGPHSFTARGYAALRGACPRRRVRSALRLRGGRAGDDFGFRSFSTRARTYARAGISAAGQKPLGLNGGTAPAYPGGMIRLRAALCLSSLLVGCTMDADEPSADAGDPIVDTGPEPDAGSPIPETTPTCTADVEAVSLRCTSLQDVDPSTVDDERWFALNIDLSSLDGVTHAIDAEIDHENAYYVRDTTFGAPLGFAPNASHDPAVVHVEVTSGQHLQGPTTYSRIVMQGTVRVDADGHGEVHVTPVAGATSDTITWNATF